MTGSFLLHTRIAAALLTCFCWRSLLAGENSPAPIGIISWNIQYGAETGAMQNTWPTRKVALRALVERENPDLLCLQEALADQVSYISTFLSDYNVVWVGRDDGKRKGESCAIFYSRKRFKPIDAGTFWLSDTPDQASRTWENKYYRICTWVRLNDQLTNATFVIGNTHFPLMEVHQQKSAELLVRRVHDICRETPFILVGDLNCGPESTPRKKLQELGLEDAGATKRTASIATYHLKGFGVAAIDTVLYSSHWNLGEYKVLNEAMAGVYPSDHFGLYAALSLTQPAETREDAISSDVEADSSQPRAVRGGQAKEL